MRLSSSTTGNKKQSVLGMRIVMHGTVFNSTAGQMQKVEVEEKIWKGPFDVGNFDLEAISTDLFHCLNDSCLWHD